jgi:hypothetical protein
MHAKVTAVSHPMLVGDKLATTCTLRHSIGREQSFKLPVKFLLVKARVLYENLRRCTNSQKRQPASQR